MSTTSKILRLDRQFRHLFLRLHLLYSKRPKSSAGGRCGRGEVGGLAIVQTFDPKSPAITFAAAHDYEGFAELELTDRLTLQLPPSTRLARIVIRDPKQERGEDTAARIARQLGELGGADIVIRGPSPCPIARIADNWRTQVEVLAPSASRLQTLLTEARARLLLDLRGFRLGKQAGNPDRDADQAQREDEECARIHRRRLQYTRSATSRVRPGMPKVRMLVIRT